MELVPFTPEPADQRVAGDRAGDVFSNRRRVLEAQSAGPLRSDASCNFDQHLPLGPGLADPRTGDLRAEDHSPLGRGLSDSAGDLIPRRGGQQHNDLGRVEQHLAGEDDVHVHPERDTLEGRLRVRRIRHHFEEVPSAEEQDVQVIARAASSISSAVKPGGAGTSKPHSSEKRLAFSSSTARPPGKLVE